MRRFEIGTRLAIGAKGKDIVNLVFKENAGALFIGVTASLLLLILLYEIFSESLNQYLTLSMLPLFISTLGVISLLSSFACYLPLRQYITRPVVHSLKGGD
jgi:putative ABC transport system permease protein